MIVVGIIAILMTIAIPAFVSAQNKTPMRNALQGVMEACATARAQAILRGSIVELHIRPQDYTFEVAPTASARVPVAESTRGLSRKPARATASSPLNYRRRSASRSSR